MQGCRSRPEAGAALFGRKQNRFFGPAPAPTPNFIFTGP